MKGGGGGETAEGDEGELREESERLGNVGIRLKRVRLGVSRGQGDDLFHEGRAVHGLDGFLRTCRSAGCQKGGTRGRVGIDLYGVGKCLCFVLLLVLHKSVTLDEAVNTPTSPAGDSHMKDI